MKKIIQILLLSLFVVPAVAEIKYNRITGGIVFNELDDQSTTLSGFGVNGDFLINKDVVLVGSYEKSSKSSLDYSAISVGARYIYDYRSNIQILAGGDLVKSTADVGTGSSSDTEIGLKVEAIYAHTDVLNINAGFQIIDGQTVFGGGADYFVQNNISFGGALMIGKNNHYSFDGTYWF